MASAAWFEVSYRKSGEEAWTDVVDANGQKATLAQILTQGIPVFAGEMTANTEVSYSLRLYMKADADLSQIQGQTLLLDIRLVATQLAQQPEGQELELPAAEMDGNNA